MPIAERVRRWRQRRMRHRLATYVSQGAYVATLPAFLDREPRHSLHRAERAAFMRGFGQAQCGWPDRTAARLDPTPDGIAKVDRILRLGRAANANPSNFPT